jgi:uncharacterized protein YidB (DUF937 family)
MALFDQIIGAVLGGANDSGATTHAALLETLASSEGGLGGILSKFQGAGLGDVVGSWIGTGQNQPISPEMIHQVLGSQVMQELAAKIGLPLDQVSALVAEHLPQVVDGLTPSGQVQPDTGSELIAAGTALLKSRFGIG